MTMNHRDVVRSRLTRVRAIGGTLVLPFVVVCCTATLAAAQPKSKPANFGGIPQKTLDKIMAVCEGTTVPGITTEMQRHVLFQLVMEEHAGANPGPGVTGTLEAVGLFEDLQIKLQNVQNGTPTQQKALTDALADSIDKLADAWRKGPPPDGFYSEEYPPSK
jgi:hypothetical protein